MYAKISLQILFNFTYYEEIYRLSNIPFDMVTVVLNAHSKMPLKILENSDQSFTFTRFFSDFCTPDRCPRGVKAHLDRDFWIFLSPNSRVLRVHVTVQMEVSLNTVTLKHKSEVIERSSDFARKFRKNVRKKEQKLTENCWAQNY